MAWWVLLALGCLVLAFLALLTKRRQLVSDSSGRGIPCPPKSSQGHHGALIAKAGGLIPFVKVCLNCPLPHLNAQISGCTRIMAR